MAATATRRAGRAARHAVRAVRRRRIPQVLAAMAAATVLAVGGAELAIDAGHDGGPGPARHGIMQQFDGNLPGGGWQDGHQDHPHPPWEH